MGRQAAIKRARRAQRLVAEARNPLGSASRYVDGLTVFGDRLTAQALVDRVKTFNWRDSFVRLGQLASDVAHDLAGPRSKKIQAWGRTQIGKMNGAPAQIARARAWMNSGDDAVIVHEEGIDFLQHVVLMYGLEEGEAPSNVELVLWLIGVGQFLGEWEDDSNGTETERLIAEMVRVSRFNNQEDPVHLLVRIRELYGRPPFVGPLSKPETGSAVQQLTADQIALNMQRA